MNTRTDDFDTDLELRVQAELARERTGQKGYTEEHVLRIGRMWHALMNANLGPRRHTRLPGSLIALWPNAERAIGADGTFYRLDYIWPRPARRRAAIRAGGIGAVLGAALAAVVLGIGGASSASWTLMPAAGLVLGALGARIGWRDLDTMERFYRPLPAEDVEAHSVELAYDEVRKALAHAEAQGQKAEAVRRFAEHDAARLLADVAN